ncbi:uncharacterized protein LOC120326590 isoform X2 [Styela clava]
MVMLSGSFWSFVWLFAFLPWHAAAEDAIPWEYLFLSLFLSFIAIAVIIITCKIYINKILRDQLLTEASVAALVTRVNLRNGAGSAPVESVSLMNVTDAPTNPIYSIKEINPDKDTTQYTEINERFESSGIRFKKIEKIEIIENETLYLEFCKSKSTC